MQCFHFIIIPIVDIDYGPHVGIVTIVHAAGSIILHSCFWTRLLKHVHPDQDFQSAICLELPGIKITQSSTNKLLQVVTLKRTCIFQYCILVKSTIMTIQIHISRSRSVQSMEMLECINISGHDMYLNWMAS